MGLKTQKTHQPHQPRSREVGSRKNGVKTSGKKKGTEVSCLWDGLFRGQKGVTQRRMESECCELRGWRREGRKRGGIGREGKRACTYRVWVEGGV